MKRLVAILPAKLLLLIGCGGAGGGGDKPEASADVRYVMIYNPSI